MRPWGLAGAVACWRFLRPWRYMKVSSFMNWEYHSATEGAGEPTSAYDGSQCDRQMLQLEEVDALTRYSIRAQDNPTKCSLFSVSSVINACSPAWNGCLGGISMISCNCVIVAGKLGRQPQHSKQVDIHWLALESVSFDQLVTMGLQLPWVMPYKHAIYIQLASLAMLAISSVMLYHTLPWVIPWVMPCSPCRVGWSSTVVLPPEQWQSGCPATSASSGVPGMSMADAVLLTARAEQDGDRSRTCRGVTG